MKKASVIFALLVLAVLGLTAFQISNPSTSGGGIEVGACNQANLATVPVTSTAFSTVFTCNITAHTFDTAGACVIAGATWHASSGAATSAVKWLFGSAGTMSYTNFSPATTEVQSSIAICETGTNAQTLGFWGVQESGTSLLAANNPSTATETTANPLQVTLQVECASACSEVIQPDIFIVTAVHQ